MKTSLVLLIIGAMAGPVHASMPTGDAAGGSLHIWEDTPDYPPIETPPDSGQADATKKGNAKSKANAPKDNPRVAKVSWDAWSVPIGNGRLGAVFWGKVSDELVQFNEDSLWTGGMSVF